ncbi:MAG: hypothetical protein EAZ51_07305 [Sphingobacteriales bacterium]|nr:MAG: hypothetical protein EAZ64_04405 [Sphingobacteriales bacterium]TAF79741.1 MAG: hypothetical protein EAZ51_07305 [Sphingobacteriales bacterium]
MKNTILITLFSLNLFICFGQENYPTSDSIHIFWQPILKITHKDYQGKPTEDIEKLMNKYGFSASASVGIWSVIDIPKNKRDRKKKFEKIYFAPAFEKTTSFTKTTDSVQIEMQNYYFDICEIWARWARKELKDYQDKFNSIGMSAIFYSTIKKEMNENKLKMYKAYFKDVFIDKKEGAFLKWRNDMIKNLSETKYWTTTPEECFRLMSQKPIEDGYILSPTIIEPMQSKENIKP